MLRLSSSCGVSPRVAVATTSRHSSCCYLPSASSKSSNCSNVSKMFVSQRFCSSNSNSSSSSSAKPETATFTTKTASVKGSFHPSAEISTGCASLAPDDEKCKLPRVVIVGSGWGAAYWLRNIDPKLYNITCLSGRNHFVFTPLLGNTSVGSLEFRSICEPVLWIQPALAHLPNRFLQTLVWDVDFERKSVMCVSPGVIGQSSTVPVKSFEVSYDILVLAHGAKPATYGIPGVEENTFFLREIAESRGIRRRLIQNIQTAALPTTDEKERKRLLRVTVCGGGAIGCEYISALSDFLKEDIPKIAPALKSDFELILIEANEVLGMFQSHLRQSAEKILTKKMNVKIKKGIVAEVTETAVILSDGEVIENGLCVWATGVGPSSLAKQLALDKNKQGRILVDDHLRVQQNGKPVNDVFCLGDAAADTERPLPTLAAVACRQGKHLAKVLNQIAKNPQPIDQTTPFKYTDLMGMVTLGDHKAIVEVRNPGKFSIQGIYAWLLWRSAYFTMLGSVRSKLYAAVNWFGVAIFGRDITYVADVSESKLWKKLAKEGATQEQTRRKFLAAAQEERRKRQEAKEGEAKSSSSTATTQNEKECGGGKHK